MQAVLSRVGWAVRPWLSCRGCPWGPALLGSSKELVPTVTAVWLCRGRTHCAEHFHTL